MREIDLHVHTNISDGSESPAETVRYAHELGLRAIAITDHDSVNGVAEAQRAGKEYGVVTDVLFTGANDVYEMADNNGKKFYIPVIDSVVVEKDIDNSIIKIRPMKGLFDDED